MYEEVKEQAGLVPIIALPQGYTTSSYLKQALPKIKGLAVKYKNSQGNPTLDAEVRGYLTFLQTFLPWLETDAAMTPTIRRESLIDKALQVLFNPLYKCLADIAARAERIYNKFEDEQWGQDNEDGPAVEPDDANAAPAPDGHGTTTVGGGIRTDDMYQLARPPPPEHPIWGARGIMHGFIIQSSAHRKFNYVLDPRCESEKRAFKVFGHNGLAPGDWWPYQKVALFHGAHGHSIAGISGHAERGAWSVVVSGSSKYEELDRDEGDTVWYSSDHSHDSVDPVRVVYRSNMALSLHASVANGSPVRVLRASGKGRFAPSRGIRYDGLYSVVGVVERKNAKGGLYEQFQLRRLPDQRPLEEIWRSSPTREQLADFERIQEGY